MEKQAKMATCTYYAYRPNAPADITVDDVETMIKTMIDDRETNRTPVVTNISIQDSEEVVLTFEKPSRPNCASLILNFSLY